MRDSRTSMFSVVFLFLAAAVLSFPYGSYAQTPTTTTLQVSACPTEGCVTTLIATVTSGAVAIHPGLVYFCDKGPADCENDSPLGSAQLTANGTAIVKLALAAGAHTLHAVFHGTTVHTKSISAMHAVVSPGNAISRVTAANVSSTGVPGNYTLHSTVAGAGLSKPSGVISFVDKTNNNAVVASGVLGPGQTSFLYTAGGLNLSAVSASLLGTAVAAATGDFNKDGYQDVALVTSGGVLDVLLGDGTGHFTAAPSNGSFSGGQGTLAVADFDGDGKLDVAILNGSKQLLIALGNGDGSFATLPAMTLPSTPNTLLVGDFNDDGIADLVAVNVDMRNSTDDTGVAYPLFGRGDGTFTAEPTISLQYANQAQPFCAATVADFDGDGKQDLAICTVYQGQTYTLHSNGDGTFVKIGTTSASTTPEVAGDFDGDGIPDLVQIFFYELYFYHGNGDGTFSYGPASPVVNQYAAIQSSVVQDLNGDGVPDILVSSTLFSVNGATTTAVLSNVDQTFRAAGSLTTPAPLPVEAVADFNGDGAPDLLAFNTGEGSTAGTPPSTALGLPTVAATATSASGIALMGLGNHDVVASYPGDANYNGSVSAPISLIGTPIDYSQGFAGATGLTLNGGATALGPTIQLTDGKQFESRSFFYSNRVPVESFITDFDFQLTNANADGFAFVVQGNGADALGSSGGGVGYSNPPNGTGPGISNSFAVVFDLHSNAGEGRNSIVFESNGQFDTNNVYDLTHLGIDLHSGHRFHAHLNLTSTGLEVDLTDMTTQVVGSLSLSNGGVLPQIRSSVGYVGFTAGTGANTAIQTIYNWTYTPQTSYRVQPAAEPSYPTGFAGASRLQLNGGTSVSGSLLKLAHGTSFEATSAYYSTLIDPANGFSTDFDFDLGNGPGDGFTFVLQDHSLTAVGTSGGGLGYGPSVPNQPGTPIPNSLAIKFDVHNNAGEGSDSTGIYLNGASPTVPSVDLSPTINLNAGHLYHANIVSNTQSPGFDYIILTIVDLTEYKVSQTTFPLANGTIQTSSAGYVGFTAGTGQTPGVVNIYNWTYATGEY